MANVRQMPKLYLRGALAHQTMANLTKSEQAHIEKLFAFVTNHPEMQRHKIKILHELGVTIAADYANDRSVAEQEYKVAVWRGLVHLYYHCDYTYRCDACSKSHYLTKHNKPKAIDRAMIPCPNCQMVKVIDPGDVKTLKVNQFIKFDDFQDSYKNLAMGKTPPKAVSAIIAIKGKKRYDDPDKIINDPKQLRKFFGEFVWNYFRQQLNENKRAVHCEPYSLVGPADVVIVTELTVLCSRLEIDYNYCNKVEPKNGWHHIYIACLKTPPEFSYELAMLRAKAASHGVLMQANRSTIAVQAVKNAKEIETLVVKPEHIVILDGYARIVGDQDSDHTITQISYRTTGGSRMDLEDHVATYDNTDAMSAIRSAIPDGNCRDVFDILSHQGTVYVAFSNKYGDNDSHLSHIANFLGITPKMVEQHKQTIKLHCLANHLVPAGV